MKSIDQVIEMYRSKKIARSDISRLAFFVPEEKLHLIGVELIDKHKGKHVPIEFTRENVLKRLEHDVFFGFQKALGKRGIPTGMMFDVVMMWNWILEEGLENWDEENSYSQYGLPLFIATASKYGFGNPIENNYSDESNLCL